MSIDKIQLVLPRLFPQFRQAVPFCLMLCFATSVGWSQPIQLNEKGAGQGNAFPSTGSKRKLSPEERAMKKQLSEEIEKEAKEERRRHFGTLPLNDESPLAKEYLEAFKEFRDALTQLDQVQYKQQLAVVVTDEVFEDITKQWLEAIDQGNRAYEQWLSKAAEIFASDPQKYSLIGDSLVEMMMNDTDRDRFDPWLAPAKALYNAQRLNGLELLSSAGLIGFANNDFDFAQLCWTPVLEGGKLPEQGKKYMEMMPEFKARWERELEFRKTEAAKDDNPRVEFITTKGRIVVELFEDAAPEAVACFMYLVENKYYSRMPVFRVETHHCAQIGCEKGDGKGNAGFTIPGEANLPNRRDHFRGTVSIALGMNPTTNIIDTESGGAQFFFGFLPLPHHNGTYTVFGRVVEGLPSLSMFRVMNLTDDEQRKDKSNRPDVVVSAKVLRKRDHEYRPNINSGRLRR
jgi:cyclophilin family peptidyl-prolyl cis-trans isomerase